MISSVRLPAIRLAVLLALAMLPAAREARGQSASAQAAAHPRAEPACVATEQTRRAEARLHALLDSLIASRPDVPGISIHVDAPRLCLSWSGAAGVADKATGAALTPAYAFRIASITKTYVAAATLRLYEDGRLRLDDPISEYTPAATLEVLGRGGYLPAQITIRQLLTHTSGLYDYAMDSAYLPSLYTSPDHRWTRLEQLQYSTTHGKPYGQPGEVFHYSDAGYIVLGSIVEQRTNAGLGVALRDLLSFDRFGLDQTWLGRWNRFRQPWPAARTNMMAARTPTPSTRRLTCTEGEGLSRPPRDVSRFFRALFVGPAYRYPATLEHDADDGGLQTQRAYRAGIVAVEADSISGWAHGGYWNTFGAYFPSIHVSVAGAFTEQHAHGLDRVVLDRTIRIVRAATAAQTDGPTPSGGGAPSPTRTSPNR